MEEYTRLQGQLNSNLNDSNQIVKGSARSFTLQHSAHKSKYHKYLSDITQTQYSASVAQRALSSSPTSQLTQSSVLLPQTSQANANHQLHYPSSNGSLNLNASVNKFPEIFTPLNSANSSNLRSTSLSNKDSQMLAEARLLRQHEDRLEARMKILENHNRLLDSQLKHLRGLLNNNKNNAGNISASTKDMSMSKYLGSSSKLIDTQKEQRKSLDRSSTNIGALFHNVEDITRAINNLNNLVNAMGSDTN